MKRITVACSVDCERGWGWKMSILCDTMHTPVEMVSEREWAVLRRYGGLLLLCSCAVDPPSSSIHELRVEHVSGVGARLARVARVINAQRPGA